MINNPYSATELYPSALGCLLMSVLHLGTVVQNPRWAKAGLVSPYSLLPDSLFFLD